MTQLTLNKAVNSLALYREEHNTKCLTKKGDLVSRYSLTAFCSKTTRLDKVAKSYFNALNHVDNEELKSINLTTLKDARIALTHLKVECAARSTERAQFDALETKFCTVVFQKEQEAKGATTARSTPPIE